MEFPQTFLIQNRKKNGPLTPKIRRLRVSKHTPNHPNVCGQTHFQLMPRLAIRLHFVVSLAGWGAKLLTFAEYFLTNLAQRLVSNSKAPPPNGAWCRGCWQTQLHFCSTLPAPPVSMKRSHDALFFSKNQSSLRRTIAGAFAA